jgi:multidrug resistance efflux pump
MSQEVIAPSAKKSRAKRIATVAIPLLIAVIGVLVVLYAWQLPPFSPTRQSTENAYVRGQVTVISPQVNGYITSVRVNDYDQVHKGDLLMTIDDRIYKQRLHQAQAQYAMKQAALANNRQQRASAEAAILRSEAAVQNAGAQAQKARFDLKRVEDLVSDGSLSVRERDASRAAAAQAQADVAQTKAALEMAKQDVQTVVVNRASLEADVANAAAAVELAEIDLANTRILAPRDGQLGQVSVRQGAYVAAGTHLTALVPQQLWVVANMKETQMARVRVGLPVTFSVDALDGAVYSGVVEKISPATGSEFSTIVADNATGNFVKIAQRLPVRIRINADAAARARLRPGMSVVVNILTDRPAEPLPPVERAQ